MSRIVARRAALAGFTMALLAAVSAPAAFAGPVPDAPSPVDRSTSVDRPTSFASWCRDDLDGFAAQLRAAGLTAQAANNAAQIARIECERTY